MAYQPKHSAGQPKHMKQPSAATKTARAAGTAAKSTPQVIKIVTDTGTVSGKKGAGISGSAVLFGTVGLYLMYVGIKKVPFLDGLRLLIRGKNPDSLAQAKGSDAQPLDLSAIAAAVAGAGPASAGVGSTTSSPAGSVPGQPTGPVGPNEITSVMGIRVHKSIAGNVSKMVAAARHDGITLAGGGYRSSLEQAATRKKNGCTCSNSSSCCRVPTAPVGKSMHERGLAIDFNNSSSHNTSVFRWLAKNASKYGFYNLPSEPWHWSTNGH